MQRKVSPQLIHSAFIFTLSHFYFHTFTLTLSHFHTLTLTLMMMTAMTTTTSMMMMMMMKTWWQCFAMLEPEAGWLTTTGEISFGMDQLQLLFRKVGFSMSDWNKCFGFKLMMIDCVLSYYPTLIVILWALLSATQITTLTVVHHHTTAKIFPRWRLLWFSLFWQQRQSLYMQTAHGFDIWP